MDSSFSPSSCTAIPWRPELPNHRGHTIFAQTWSKPAPKNGQRKFIVEKLPSCGDSPPPPQLTTSHNISPHPTTSNQISLNLSTHHTTTSPLLLPHHTTSQHITPQHHLFCHHITSQLTTSCKEASYDDMPFSTRAHFEISNPLTVFAIDCHDPI